jgi:hypothetical protein
MEKPKITTPITNLPAFRKNSLKTSEKKSKRGSLLLMDSSVMKIR